MEIVKCATCKHAINCTDNYCLHCGAVWAITGQTSPLNQHLYDEHKFKHRQVSLSQLVVLIVTTGVLLIGSITYAMHERTTSAPVLPANSSIINDGYKKEAFSYSVYYDRRSWENAIYSQIFIENFEGDAASSEKLNFPYITGARFLLEGEGLAKITASKAWPTGHRLDLTDWQIGSTLHFPKTGSVTAIGFDYMSSEDWTLIFGESALNNSLTIPQSQKTFIGIVFTMGDIDWFRLASKVDNGQISIDNISFVTESYDGKTK